MLKKTVPKNISKEWNVDWYILYIGTFNEFCTSSNKNNIKPVNHVASQ
jgi:hypothetical protein